MTGQKSFGRSGKMEVIVDTSKGVYRERIVRCKDCKWARPTATSEDIYCEPYKHYRYADGFCSYGEVRDE